jgi:hypothetical protein
MTNNFSNYIIFIGLVVSLSIGFNSCTDEVVEMSRRNRIVADSVFRATEVGLRKEVDSLCLLVYKERFDRAVDSISAIRLQEIEKILSVK